MRALGLATPHQSNEMHETDLPMNRKQFARLFLVAFLPLLLLGFVTAKVVFEHSGDKYAYILCIPANTFENCRSLGEPDGSLYKLTKDYSPAWFDVTEDGYDSNSRLSNFVMASTRSVRGAEVVRAAPFAGYGEDVELIMNSLVGKRAVVNLGIKKDELSSIHRDGVLLFCNNLWFGAKHGEYTSQCYGDGWGGAITYQVTGQSRRELERLQAAINDVVATREAEYFAYRAVMYPLFIYLFLIISFLVWITIKAARFVKGDTAAQLR